MNSFLTKHSFNIGGGYGVGGQATYVPGSGWGVEVGATLRWKKGDVSVF